MILPDVNALVYAYRVEAERHDEWRSWLEDVRAGADELALVDDCLTGFVRIVTHPRIMAVPSSTSDALAFVDALRAARRARPLAATRATWETLARLVGADRAIKGNLVPDAYLASLAISHGCRLATADRGFGRFAGLDHFDPIRY